MKKKQWFTLFLSLLCIFSFLPSDLQAEITKPTIVAPAAILIDAKTKTILYEKNAHEIHYPASITKLMTALLAIENLEPDQKITFSRDAVYSIEPGSSHIGIQEDEVLTVNQALHGLLLMSANEVANGLAEAVSGSLDAFANRMTERAKELGALNTHFTNAHGLHDENHYTTAYDMALIASYLCENKYFLDIMQDFHYEIPPTNITNEIRYLYQQHPMLNPNRDCSIHRKDVIGGKTGYTDQAKHTLVTMAQQGDTTLVAVVLQSDKSTLYSDTSALFDYGFASYQTIDLHTSDDILKTLPAYLVKSGHSYHSSNYGLGIAEDVSIIALNTVTADDVIPVFDLPDYLPDSYQVGDIVGTVSFTLNGQTLRQSDLVIKQIDSVPTQTLPFTSSQNLKWIKLGLIILVSIIIIFSLTFFIRKRHSRKKYIKINKYFK
ncbi:MAG: D-alanyl-D-alanine carboxypeptidase [Cellulosilyticum sp.]|nr:D-alanyl-D-alanine carboxypeptidase [Cellulosilyticum sp.]